MPKNNVLRYVGSKTHAIDIIDQEVKNIKFNKIIELFCSFCIISLELNKRYNLQKSICVDIDKNIIDFFNHIKINGFELILEYYEKNWNALKNNRKIYYDIRERFNNNNNVFDWYFLNRTCICGLMRYNRGNLNCSLHPNRNGIKPKTLQKIFESNINQIKKIDFILCDCLDYVNINSLNDSLIIMDPPYFSTVGMYYSETNVHNKLIKIINKIKDNKLILFYGSQFDDCSQILENYFVKKIEIGKTKNPGSFFRKVKSNDNSKVLEHMYLNF